MLQFLNSFNVVSICINVESWWFCINPTPFMWNSDELIKWVIRECHFRWGVLLSLSNGRSVNLSYHWCKISWNRIDEPRKDLALLGTLGSVLKVGTCHSTGEFSPGKTRVWKWDVFPIFSDFLSSRYQVPWCISTPSNDGSKFHRGF
jgi:hypothetical protein